ncbi:YiiX/YebB-like N1pC/P60 family cysteine hydrolase [Flammeovirga pacifica]|uniref:Permuted papain-like amidase YaeF/Yiix C92 family enzyme n=1 Tax=Flammeovirga pacifica TaxID=915059 RepID=A0A1S1YTB2_FLAPC|nr:YiiX/YebB-like N1pC/P60 family cysteine hydrolase [Flammeovirga pacifica]OHX64267.1 hypothetical protein NH26_21945 [Flammeovirga pacifica]
MKYIILIISIFAFSSCNSRVAENSFHYDLKEGDIIFQDLDCGDFCIAINKVTEGWDGRDFSHCAIVVKEADSLLIIEAVGQGVKRTSLKDFFNKHTGKGGNVRGRMKAEYSDLAPLAAKNAFQYLGKSYDDVFDINNDQYYCSELIYETYKEANNNKEIFHLYPMTYKDPDTKEYFPIWVDYFKQLNTTIPQDEPGLNPGGVSRSKYLDIEVLDIK